MNLPLAGCRAPAPASPTSTRRGPAQGEAPLEGAPGPSGDRGRGPGQASQEGGQALVVSSNPARCWHLPGGSAALLASKRAASTNSPSFRLPKIPGGATAPKPFFESRASSLLPRASQAKGSQVREAE